MDISFWDDSYTYTDSKGKRRRMVTGFGISMIMTGAVVVVMTIIIIIGNLASAKSCYDRADIYGVTADYGMMTGCIVTTDEGVITSIDKLITTREG